MNFFKSILGKILTGLIVLIVIAAAISWWRMDPVQRDALLWAAGRLAGWIGLVLVLPWATFFIIARVGRMDSNAAGAALVAAYTLIELILLGWLIDWNLTSPLRWIFFILGIVTSAAYNLFTCDWIAEKV
jgi:hypothetical protein